MSLQGLEDAARCDSTATARELSITTVRVDVWISGSGTANTAQTPCAHTHTHTTTHNTHVSLRSIAHSEPIQSNHDIDPPSLAESKRTDAPMHTEAPVHTEAPDSKAHVSESKTDNGISAGADDAGSGVVNKTAIDDFYSSEEEEAGW